jgi:hypothetical protein
VDLNQRSLNWDDADMDVGAHARAAEISAAWDRHVAQMSSGPMPPADNASDAEWMAYSLQKAGYDWDVVSTGGSAGGAAARIRQLQKNISELQALALQTQSAMADSGSRAEAGAGASSSSGMSAGGDRLILERPGILDEQEVAADSDRFRADNLARIQRMAGSSEATGYVTGLYSSNPESIDYYKQPDGGYRIVLSGMASGLPSVGGDAVTGPGLTPSLQAANDAKAVAGTLNIFGEAWDSVLQGNWSQAWAHLNYQPSDAARAAVYARVFPQPNPALARIDAAAGGPIGAASVLLTQNSSARDQYYAAQVGMHADALAGAFTGVYPQTLTAKPPTVNPLASRLRNPINGRFIPDPQNPASPHTFTDAQRRQAWRDLAQDPASPFTPAQRQEIEGRNWRGPQRVNQYGELETMELSHEPIPLRNGGTQVVPRWPDEHAAVDPFRRLKNRDHD